MAVTETRKCKACKLDKPLDKFPKGKDLAHTCWSCRNKARNAERKGKSPDRIALEQLIGKTEAEQVAATEQIAKLQAEQEARAVRIEALRALLA